MYMLKCYDNQACILNFSLSSFSNCENKNKDSEGKGFTCCLSRHCKRTTTISDS